MPALSTVRKNLVKATQYALDHTTEEARNTLISRIDSNAKFIRGFLYHPGFPSISTYAPPAFCLIGLCIPNDLLPKAKGSGRLSLVFSSKERHRIFTKYTRDDGMYGHFDRAMNTLGEAETRAIIQNTIKEWEAANVPA